MSRNSAAPEFQTPPQHQQSSGPWHAEASIAAGKLTFKFNEDPGKGIVVAVEAEPGAEYSAAEIRRLHAALGNVLAQLD